MHLGLPVWLSGGVHAEGSIPWIEDGCQMGSMGE